MTPTKSLPRVCVTPFRTFLREDMERIIADKPLDPTAKVITGYTGTATQLKRQLEIAAMDEAELRERVGIQIQRWLNGHALPSKYPTVVDAVLDVIGLTAPKPKRSTSRRSR